VKEGLMKKVLLVASGVVLVAGLTVAAEPMARDLSDFLPEQVVEVGPLRIPQTVDREVATRQLQDLHAWLMAEQVAAGIEDPLTVELTSEELEDIEFGASTAHLREPEAQRVGIAKPVSVEMVLLDPDWGATRKTFEGGRVWSGAVRSAGAYGLRVHFDNFWLPPDTELYIFNAAGEVFGPYTEAGPLGTGEFWSHTVHGEVAFLQLRQYGPAGREKLNNTYFDVVDIGHVSRGFGRRPGNAFNKAFCAYNEPCIFNASCGGIDPAVTGARAAVAHMQYVKRPYLYICSGGLINSTVDPGTPYFLTANHCISRDREARTLEAYFHYSVNCSGSCPAQWSQPDTPRTLGSSVVATNKTGDFTLLLLSESAPSGTTMLGWTTEAVAHTRSEQLYRISHPSGAPQSYSEHVVDIYAGTCTSWPRGPWIYSRDTYGATEGGSSGSPVVNGDGLVVGQLSGGCGTNVYETCDNENNATVDGAFAHYYDQVAPYLGSGECIDADGDGYDDEACGGDDCDDSDFWVNPGVSENCDDSIDNNCDGNVNEGCGGCWDNDGDGYDDTACGGTDCDDNNFLVNPGADEVCGDGVDNDCVDGDEPCVCAPAGAACTVNSDCCSNRCHPRKLTCK
jgi:V8-like Glu-specific endopeptidase